MESELILTLDTARTGTRVGLVCGETVLAHVYEPVRGRHAPGLIGRIERALTIAGKTIDEVAGLVVCVGPGFFTGVRVGMATMQGLAVAGDLPLLGITSLDCLALQGAFQAAPDRAAGHYLPVISAGRGMYYCALYTTASGEAEDISRISDYGCLAVDGLYHFIASRTDCSWSSVWIVGDGSEMCGKELARAGYGVQWLPAPAADPNECLLMVKLAVRQQAADTDADTLPRPVYIRRPPILKPAGKPRSESVTRSRTRGEGSHYDR